MAIDKERIFEVWFAPLRVGPLDLFSYNHSFGDFLKKGYSIADAKSIEDRVASLNDKSFNFFLPPDRNTDMTLTEFIDGYEDIACDRGCTRISSSPWEYNLDLIRTKLPAAEDFIIDTDAGKRNILLLMMGYRDSKYNPERLKGILDTRFNEEDEKAIKELYFEKLKKRDFSFLPKGELKDKFRDNLVYAQSILRSIIYSEMSYIREASGLNDYESVITYNKLEYKRGVIDLLKRRIRRYPSDIVDMFSKEIKNFNSEDSKSLRDNLSKKKFSALFCNKSDKENSRLLSLSGRIKHIDRVIEKVAFKSIIGCRKDKDYKIDNRALKIDDFVISDVPGIMEVYDHGVDIKMIRELLYKRPFWITIEDKPNYKKEGQQRQTKLLHSKSGIIIDVHERNLEGLFACQFGENSQDLYELRKYQRLDTKEKELLMDYASELKKFFSEGFEFKAMG